MKIKIYVAALLVALAAGIGCVLLLFPVPENVVDIAQINDYAQSGRIVDASAFDDTLTRWREYRLQVQTGMIALACVFAAIAAVFLFTLYYKILRPFRTMRGFAQRVAAGELDVPLTMDRNNAFGAFTESFDLMREELRRAQESERAAEQSKRELVASLSHDVQTPVASIKAVAELMEVTADEAQRERLTIIQQKAGQIGTLVSELFHATLEELNSLSVKAVSFPSNELAEMVRNADYQRKVSLGEIPGCLLLADPARLSQVVDNIISNSYKYADTPVDVSAETDAGGLTLVIRDYGQGASAAELPYLCAKYFRGTAAKGKDGYGLGLFISRTLVERMGGRLECANAAPGFVVKVRLRFDG
jgi:signal transduction histidine kinase